MPQKPVSPPAETGRLYTWNDTKGWINKEGQPVSGLNIWSIIVNPYNGEIYGATAPELKPCPYCGHDPSIGQSPIKNPRLGYAKCINPKCPVKPGVKDCEGLPHSYRSDHYKMAAILRWNKWVDLRR